MAVVVPAVQILAKDLRWVVQDDSEPSHYRRFNNSLLHYRDDLYLMTYRIFLPSTVVRKFKSDSRNRHPWSSNWSSILDDTVVAVLKRHPDDRFEVLRELPLHYPHHLRNFGKNLQDARMVQLKGKFYLYGQAWITPWADMAPEIAKQHPQASIQECLKKESDCALVTVLLEEIHLPVDRYGLPNDVQIVDINVPCLRQPNVYQKRGYDIVEKNWCFFEHKKEIFFEYMLSPHIVYDLKCQTRYEIESPLTPVQKDIGCGIFFSPGGPLQPWDEHHLIGCGHVKYRYKCTSLLANIHHKYMHPQSWGGLVYGMFFYLVRRDPPFALTRFSPAFLPRHPDMQYTIVFPMACLPVDPAHNRWAISYGEGDDTPNIMILSRDDIAEQLNHQPASGAEFTMTWRDAVLRP